MPSGSMKISRSRSLSKSNLARAGISRVEVERVADRCSINIHTARPGIVIGRRGAEAEKLQALLEKEVGCPVRINVSEIKESLNSMRNWYQKPLQHK